MLTLFKTAGWNILVWLIPCVVQVLAALLHMGNIKYKGKVIDHLDATDIPDHSNVERVAAILGVQKQSLIDALTSKTIFAQVGEHLSL